MSDKPRVLRDNVETQAEAATVNLGIATNAFSNTSYRDRDRAVAIAQVHATLAQAEAIHLLAHVADGIWAQMARELVGWREAKQPNRNGKAAGEGRRM